MKKIRILFQGDSITDAGRDRRNYHDMGHGYPKFAAEHISEMYPNVEFEFINLGISGNRTSHIFDRLTADATELQPDIFSILVGINDVWHRYSWELVKTSDEQIEVNYRHILERIKNETNAKILMMSPYLLDCEDKEDIRNDLKSVLPTVRRLADKYADAFIPLDILFAEALKDQPQPQYYSADGVHPNENGARFIGKLYAEAVRPFIDELIAK